MKRPSLPPPRPKNYLDLWENEKFISNKSKKEIRPTAVKDHVQTSWKTFKPKNGSYLRPYQHQRVCRSAYFEDCETTVFGIKYKNQRAYAHAINAYIAFKQSLEKLPIKRSENS